MLLLTPRAKIESSFYLVIGDDPIVFVGGSPQVRSGALWLEGSPTIEGTAYG